MSAAKNPNDDLRQELEHGLEALRLDLDERARNALLGYVRLLAHWNRAYNLTAVREPREMISRHVLDCLAVAPHVRGARLLDVGTGAGLPGFVIAVARPDVQCTLLDSSAKKMRFCRQVVSEITLPNVEIVRTRVQDYRPQAPFSTVVSRAFGSLAVLAAMAVPVLAAGGCVLAMKGAISPAELEELGPMGENARVVPLSVPGLAAQRHLVILCNLRSEAIA